jgi:hypothetical protein
MSLYDDNKILKLILAPLATLRLKLAPTLIDG